MSILIKVLIFQAVHGMTSLYPLLLTQMFRSSQALTFHGKLQSAFSKTDIASLRKDQIVYFIFLDKKDKILV